MNNEEILLNDILSFYSPKEQEQILIAYNIANESLNGKLRENKHPFIEHPLGVAQIVAKEIGLQYDAIIAIFLHESIRFNPDLLQKIPKNLFSDDIITIATSLIKIAAIKPKETKLEADNYKRLIVSYSKDPRVTIIKLADRLEVMRNIYLLPKSSQERKATETILLYIPIAHQLGLYKLKSELEDIFFKYTEPENYRMITNLLSASESDRKNLVTSFIAPLTDKIKGAGINAIIKSRTKTTYSIWKKMKKQNIPFSDVYDVSAIRIIIDCPPEKEKEHELCWKVYSIVTEDYTPDTTRLRDWITKPKTNGYESLHTTISDKKGNIIEVQIRTVRMDLIAENGLASHWSYKGIKGDDSLKQWLSSVRSILESEQKSGYEHTSAFIKDEVFVFTPEGELRRLPEGACVLDFAFNIHSSLGLKCSGAKVDGKIVSIREKLHTGSIVEIIDNKNQKASADWLNYVVTPKAKSKIRQVIKEEETKKAAIGKETLGRRVKNWKLEYNDEDLAYFCKKYKFKSNNEFFATLSEDKINLTEIKEYLISKGSLPQNAEIKDITKLSTDQIQINKKKEDQTNFLIIDGKLRDVGYKMAKCCNPIFGDEVFGFVSIKDGIKIHRISCSNAARLIEKYPYRIQKVKWKDNSQTSSFQASLKIIIDDSSVFSAILNTINSFNIPLRSSNLTQRENKNKGDYNATIQILVVNNQQLDKILSAIKKLKGVETVLRG